MVLRRYGLIDYSIKAVVFLFMFWGVSSGIVGGAENETDLRSKYKGCLWGIVCADATSQLAGKKFTSSIRESLCDDIIKFSNSIISEGGFDPNKCLSSVGGTGFLKNGLQDKSTILSAYKQLLNRQSVLGGKDRNIIFTVPVTLAYSRIPAEAGRASEICASFEDPANKPLIGAGRAYSSLLLSCLNGNIKNRKNALKKAVHDCGVDLVRQRLDRVLTDEPLDPVSPDPGEMLAVVFRAWYDSKSYAGAFKLLDENSTCIQRLLLGALAGATYGLSDVPYKSWPSHINCERLEMISNQLASLARDGILLEVRDYKNRTACASDDSFGKTIPENKVSEKEKLLLLPPEIPEIPAIPCAPQIPSGPDMAPSVPTPGFETESTVISASDVSLIKKKASQNSKSEHLKIYWSD